MDGFLLIDKPAGLTSFDCVEKIKQLIGMQCKVGHTGTLDMFATGLLVVAVGRAATKHIKSIMTLDKIYFATAKYGELTDTLDCTGIVIASEKVAVDLTKLKEAIVALGSCYWQVPPIFSALKHQGKRLSDWARTAKDKKYIEQLAIKKRNLIDIFSIQIVASDNDFFTTRSHVSHGTYVRSLVYDLAKIMGGYATTYSLRREKIGPFVVDQALALDSLDCKTIEQKLVATSEFLSVLNNYQKEQVKSSQLRKLLLFKSR